ncbi:hypothetical protein DK853_40405, partial [Klebsiella oxytoca]
MEVIKPPTAIPFVCPLWLSPIAEQIIPAMDSMRFQKGIQHPRMDKMPRISPAIATLLFFAGIVSYT